MTIRAEDGRGYVTRSGDGLEWEEPRPRTWHDGGPIEMSTTQQRWLVHSEQLHLVYTRKDAAKEPDRVAHLGNFHATSASPEESWVTVGEVIPKEGYRGDLLLARIRWSRPNALSGR
jgi:hypothetical protein